MSNSIQQLLSSLPSKGNFSASEHSEEIDCSVGPDQHFIKSQKTLEAPTLFAFHDTKMPYFRQVKPDSTNVLIRSLQQSSSSKEKKKMHVNTTIPSSFGKRERPESSLASLDSQTDAAGSSWSSSGAQVLSSESSRSRRKRRAGSTSIGNATNSSTSRSDVSRSHTMSSSRGLPRSSSRS